MSPAAKRSARARALPPMLPKPRRAEPLTGSFALADGLPIVLRPDAGERDFAAARALRDRTREICGVSLAIEGHFDGRGLGRRIELDVDAAAGAEAEPAVRGQGYRLCVTPERVSAVGGGPAGLRYALETLVQLVTPGAKIPACRIDDSPAFEQRGILLDVSRGKVPKPESLRWLIDLCAALKLNVLMLYTEHTFRFRRHPTIGRDDSPLDAETMRDLDAYAAERFVDLVPTLQSLGHMEHILKLPPYRELAETEQGWTLAPAEPRSYELLRDLIDEYLPNFRSPFFNANCDEPWDLGRGRSAELAEELGPGGLYLEHVRRVREMARRHGKRTMIWGDVVHAHPERMEEIDRDSVLLDWWYEAEFDYDRVAVFARHGIEFLVCPGTSSWNSLFPRVENSLRNISGWADAGRRHGARGLINTDWGDFGHYNLQGNSLFGYAWGAQESWSGRCAAGYFDRAFSRRIFDDRSGEVARLYRALGAVHDPGFTTFNGSALQYLFFDDVGSAYFISACSQPKLRAALARLGRVRARVEAALERHSRERLVLQEILYAVDASCFALEKARAGLDYNAWRAEPESWRAVDRRRLARRLADGADEQLALGRRLKRLWLARSELSNFDDTRRRLMRSVRALRRAARALERNRPGRAPTPEPITIAGVRRAVEESLSR